MRDEGSPSDAPPPVMLPGDRHFVSDMDISSLLVSPQRCLLSAPLTDAVRSPGGCASVGMLVTLVDLAASDPALATCRPDWTATQDLSVHAAAWITEGPALVDSRLVRVGKKTIVVASDVYDAHGTTDFGAIQDAIDQRRAPGDGATKTDAHVTLAATSLLTFVRIPRSAAGGVDDYDPSSWMGEIRHRSPGSEPAGTMYERIGLRLLDADHGHLELDRNPYVVNSIGTINGGAQAILAEVAAEAMCPGLTASDMTMRFLSQVKTGPARTRGTVLRDDPDHSVVDVELVDAGNDDQLLALATVTLREA